MGDSSALLYLPIAPDIEEPEDGFIPEPDSGSSPKRDQENAGPSPAKKKRTKTTEIQLENAPQDEVHPLLHKTGTKERGASKKPQGKPEDHLIAIEDGGLRRLVEKACMLCLVYIPLVFF